MADSTASHGDLVAEFIGLTSASDQVAHQYLENSSWDLQSAVTEYYNPPEPTSAVEQQDNIASGSASEVPTPSTTTSMGPPPSSSASTGASHAQKKKFATLGDLSGSASGSAWHSRRGSVEDNADDDLDDDPNFYAGGEKSGLAVENPDDLKRKIIERAKQNLQRPGGDAPQQPRSRFTGTARTLGGDDTPSEIVADPTTAEPAPLPRVTRQLHFWSDGFSVDDGPLYRLDDPRNAEILAQIKSGRAPLHLLNVAHGQDVDVSLVTHAEAYTPPKKKYKPFGGSGQRLGSPVPGLDTSTPSSIPSNQASATASTNSTAPQSPTAMSPTIAIDDSQPTISLQIRLADGSRRSSRFNTSHTIGDVYEFVASAGTPEGQARSWVLMTTFPSKELTDKSQKLEDLADFKRGGVVVQKWQ